MALGNDTHFALMGGFIYVSLEWHGEYLKQSLAS